MSREAAPSSTCSSQLLGGVSPCMPNSTSEGFDAPLTGRPQPVVPRLDLSGMQKHSKSTWPQTGIASFCNGLLQPQQETHTPPSENILGLGKCFSIWNCS